MRIILITALIFASGSLLAQERAATGSLDTENTWTNLSSQISGINSKMDGAKTRMAQVILCGNKGMLYAPGVAGSDSSGCRPVAAAATLASCYQRAGSYGANVSCNSGEIITKVCSSGADADCIAPSGTIYSGGQTALDGWQGPRTPTTLTGSRGVYTVITCCKIQQ